MKLPNPFGIPDIGLFSGYVSYVVGLDQVHFKFNLDQEFELKLLKKLQPKD
jgi:hypothetical protein